MELEKSLANYINKRNRAIKGVVEHKSGLKIPEPTLHAWHNMLGAIRLLDNAIDENGNAQARLKIGRDIVGFLNSDNNSSFDFDSKCAIALSLLRDDVNLLAQDKKESFLRDLTIALKVGERIKQADDPRKFALLTRLEGQVVSKLFIHFLPEEFQANNFLKWFHRLGRVGNLYDSFIDWDSDYKNHETIISPSIGNRLSVMAQARADTWHLFTHSQPALFGALLGISVSFARKEPAYVYKRRKSPISTFKAE